MRHVALWLSLVVCVALVSSLLLAADEEGAGGTEKALKPVPKIKGDAKKEAAKLGDIGMKMDKIVTFTDEQKTSIAEINKRREAALKELNDKFVKDALALMTEEQRAAWEQASKENPKKDGAAKNGQPKEPKVKVDKTGAGNEGGDVPK